MTILDLAVGVRASIIRITTRAFSFIFINEKLYRWRVRNIPERRWINIIFSRTPRRVYTHYYTGQSSELLCISTRRCFVVIVVVVVYTLDEKSILEMIVMIIKKKERSHRTTRRHDVRNIIIRMPSPDRVAVYSCRGKSHRYHGWKSRNATRSDPMKIENFGRNPSHEMLPALRACGFKEMTKLLIGYRPKTSCKHVH